MNKGGWNASTAKGWRKFRDDMMLMLLKSSESEVIFCALRKKSDSNHETWYLSEDTYFKILKHDERYYCPPVTLCQVLWSALDMTDFTNSHITLMRYMLLCHLLDGREMILKMFKARSLS